MERTQSPREESPIMTMTMTMTSSLRKFALTVHVTSSVGLLGSIAAFLALAIVGLSTQETQIIRAAYLAMDLTARLVIVPLALASLLTGIIQSMGTPWGLFRHYWVLTKFFLTAFATSILLVKVELIGYAAHLAGEVILPNADLRAVGFELVIHAAGGLLVLLVPAVLSVYKPRGRTPYGHRKQQEQKMPSQQRYFPPQHPSFASTASIGVSPGGGAITIRLRHAHIFGTSVVVLILHFVILHLAGVGFGGH